MRRIVNVDYSIDEHGKNIVSVPLRDGQEAILYETDFDLLMDMGCPVSWTTQLGIVKIRPLRGYNISIARLLLDAGRKQQVLYANGDKLDLRRTNLVLAVG